MGGITTAMQLADAAYGFELPVTLGAPSVMFMPTWQQLYQIL